MRMKKWCVYILRCRDGSLYTGITNDLKARVAAHDSGKGAKYTRSRRPVVLAWKENKKNESYARKREAAIKGMSKAEKESLLRGG